jgi:L-2,4-diaminobutyric acid acetyltransferase
VISQSAASVVIDHPVIADGVACWELASASQVLDVNSRYAYLIWCRDFAATSVVARRDGQVVGFVTGYHRPDAPGTLVVWQVAVDAAARGQGLAGRMLDEVFGRSGAGFLETTITPDNAASIALFAAFAKRHGARIDRSDLFDAELLGDGHLPEDLYRIGPFK